MILIKKQMDKFIDIIKNNSAISEKSVTKIFTEACHGFCTARADVSLRCWR
jgi:hypothetical protein